ncbi:class I SAM-dependent DNA methyltransferase [Listeria aquatica]|uniref:Class I SAM-dependent methyltransferase n=1 Tax=Listeria aquatica TaxID=1494960 RepID=A0A841ZP99_9LIST|nr:class I SAM-dependent methyltransferase [Listeria aquatica]MBC1520995.1 class I SAM-dependent methyltransferase [Listeria aquatica]
MSYEFFPVVYDELMDGELYDAWTEFALSHLPEETHSLLDLASGTGEFSLRMALAGLQVSGLDLAPEMVRVSREKFAQIDLKIPVVQADMTHFDLKQEFDAVTCFCDSLNYLETEEAVRATFQNVYKHLKKDGTFLFDVHSIYKVDQVFANYSYGEGDPYISTIWNSFPGEHPHSVEHELSFFIQEGEKDCYIRKDELHKERTFPISTYKKFLLEANFCDIQVFGDFSDESPNEKTERLFFKAKK